MSTAIVKLLAIVSKGDNTYLDDFLKKHGFDIDESYYQKINDYVDRFYNLLINKENNLKREDLTSAVYSFIAVAIEKTFHKYSLSLSKPTSWTIRKIKPYQPKATTELINNLDAAFVELDDMLKDIQETINKAKEEKSKDAT
ncbi:MAG TPA: hypothetical protein P5513_06300 [Candidatus Diapherotrites archaeon]|nr:hypothetical protein [Candidatus Diapherotrites archaeon]